MIIFIFVIVSRYEGWLRSVDWDFSIFPIFRVGVVQLPCTGLLRIGELGTKKFVFGNLHKNYDSGKAKKKTKNLHPDDWGGSEILK